MIKVVNVRDYRYGGYVYVGRGRGSVLGNPYKIGKDGDRDEVIRKYRVWLWKEYLKEGEVTKAIDALVQAYIEDGQLLLGCWCAPEPCHADVIKRLVMYLVKHVANPQR